MSPLRVCESSLLVVDMQQGFTTLCPDELPVPGGLEIVPRVNELLRLPWARIDASLDWHPRDHRSFLGQKDNLYPPHSVAGTRGAEFIPGLETSRFHTLWRKGYDRDFEAYAVTAQHPALSDFFRASGITTIAVCGLATNICCAYAARDLRRAGFRVLLVEDASAGIDIPDANVYQHTAKVEGQQSGVEYVPTHEVVEAMSRGDESRR